MSVIDVETEHEQAHIERIRQEARLLAGENRRSDPAITKIFWFPDTREVRLIELETTMPQPFSDAVEPFYFPASAAHNINAPSGIALIRPEEYRKLSLPPGWGTWDDAEELDIEV